MQSQATQNFKAFYKAELSKGQSVLDGIKAHGQGKGYDLSEWVTAAFYYAACYSLESTTTLTDAFPVIDASTIPKIVEHVLQNKPTFERSHTRCRASHWGRFMDTVRADLGDTSSLTDRALSALLAGASAEERFRRLKALTKGWFYWGPLAHWDFCEALNEFLPEFPVVPSMAEFITKGGRPLRAGVSLCDSTVQDSPGFLNSLMESCRTSWPPQQGSLVNLYTLESALCRWYKTKKTTTTR